MLLRNEIHSWLDSQTLSEQDPHQGLVGRAGLEPATTLTKGRIGYDSLEVENRIESRKRVA